MPKRHHSTGAQMGVGCEIAGKKNPAERLTRGISSRMWRWRRDSKVPAPSIP